jgi:hypothetical protein
MGIGQQHERRGRGGGGVALNRLVVSVDACGFGRLGMLAKKRLRQAMYAAYAEACEAVGVRAGDIHQEDRGDGILAALGPAVPPADMAGPWLDTLHQSVREHNQSGGVPLRLRVAMHAGLVAHDGKGLVGNAVDLTCRLCDSQAARRIIDDTGADLVLVVSDALYRTVIREGGRYIEPDHYTPARVTNKETDQTAWFHIPRQGPPPPPTETGKTATPPEPDDGASYDVFVAYGSGDVAWVRAFAGWLAARGVRVAYDELLARPGGVRVHTLESAIRDAAHGLLVFSSDVGDDGWVRREYAALMGRSIENEAQRFIPVLVGDPGTPLKLPEFADVLYPADFRGADEATYERMGEQIVRVVRRNPG